MNIKDYYSGMSRLYINQTVLFAVVFSTVILPLLTYRIVFPAVAAGIFILVCTFYFFLRFLYFSYKSNTLPSPNLTKRPGSSLYMIMPSPISAYRWRLYAADGICQFSIIELKGKEKKTKINPTTFRTKIFKVTDHRENRTSYIFKEKKSIKIYMDNIYVDFTTVRLKKRAYSMSIGNDSYLIKRTAYKCTLSKNGQEIMTVSKGVMPLSLQKLFNASTPIVKFNSRLNNIEKHLCLFIALSFQ